MTRRNIANKKELIKKKIENRHERSIFIGKNQNHGTMNPKDERRFQKVEPKPDLSGLNRNDRRTGNYGKVSEDIYVKKEYVDYDVIICIPTHNRYEKLKRIIEQFKSTKSNYTYLIVILNDGSSDERYDTLPIEFPEIIYMKNEIPNGKTLHWYCYNQMWKILRNKISHAVLQMDDDFILCDDFFNIIVNLFFEKKFENNKIMAISPHLWSFNEICEYESWWHKTNFVDGIALIDYDLIKFLDYELKPVDIDIVSKPGSPVRVWTQISSAIKEYNGIIYRTLESLVFHDGNDDSKLHADFRIEGHKFIYTQKYIDKI